MSTIQRQIVWGGTLAFIIACLFAATFFIVFPLTDWSDLWDKHFMDIPFALFIPASSIVIGVIFGMTSGYFWRSQLNLVDQSLHLLEEGKHTEIKEIPSLVEVQSIAGRIVKIGKQMAEQAILSQRLATEKVEDQESRIQEIISQERNRLARELHDSVSQQLFAATMLLSALNQNPDPASETATKQRKLVEGIINEAQLEMRALLLHFPLSS